MLAAEAPQTAVNDEMTEVSHVEHKESDWKNTVKAVLGLYKGISDSDKNAIQDSLENLATAATSKAGTQQAKNLFVQSAINYADEMEVYVYWSNIYMEYHDGKSTSLQSSVDITEMKLKFDKTMWL